jgi:hypothetical protein
MSATVDPDIEDVRALIGRYSQGRLNNLQLLVNQ